MAKGELKKYKLTARRRVTDKSRLLSNTVLVREASGSYPATVSFSDDLVDLVGRLLPQGVSEFNPAYLIVVHPRNTGDSWQIQACYFRDDDSAVLLWTSEQRPAWLPPGEKAG